MNGHVKTWEVTLMDLNTGTGVLFTVFGEKFYAIKFSEELSEKLNLDFYSIEEIIK